MKRFWDKVDKTPGQGPRGTCWEWQAQVSSRGYGQFWFQDYPWRAHRAAWTLTKGEIPDGLCVLHRCDNPSCCNPDHLFLGTDADNMADRDRKGRQARGERQGSAKLIKEEVKEIRRLYRPGQITLQQLAKKFSISVAQISDIVNRKYWKHV